MFFFLFLTFTVQAVAAERKIEKCPVFLEHFGGPYPVLKLLVQSSKSDVLTISSIVCFCLLFLSYLFSLSCFFVHYLVVFYIVCSFCYRFEFRQNFQLFELLDKILKSGSFDRRNGARGWFGFD